MTIRMEFESIKDFIHLCQKVVLAAKITYIEKEGEDEILIDESGKKHRVIKINEKNISQFPEGIREFIKDTILKRDAKEIAEQFKEAIKGENHTCSEGEKCAFHKFTKEFREISEILERGDRPKSFEALDPKIQELLRYIIVDPASVKEDGDFYDAVVTIFNFFHITPEIVAKELTEKGIQFATDDDLQSRINDHPANDPVGV